MHFIEKYKRSKNQDRLFSILIPTWNNLPYLQLVLRSLRQNSRFDHQIIVIVNEGKDGTKKWVDEETDLDYVYAKENIGICLGLNAARSLIQGKYVCFFNDDMYACPSWDVPLWKRIQSLEHHYFFLSATMIEPHEHQNPCVIVQNFGDTVENFHEQALLDALPNFKKENWRGATWPPNVMPLDLWDLVGGMSVEFSPGIYSDPDLSRKLWAVGVRHFEGVGSSLVYHFASKTTKKVRQNKGRKTFLLKWGISSNWFTEKVLGRGKKMSEEAVFTSTEPSFVQRVKAAFVLLFK